MKILKLLYLTGLFLLFQQTVFGQGWERLYPNIGTQQGSDVRKVIPAPGGGFLMLIADVDGSSADFNFNIVKIAETGAVKTVHHFDFGGGESAQDFIALSDGGYAVFYQTLESNVVLKSYLLKLDAQFNQVYQREVLPGQPISNNGARKILETKQQIWVLGTSINGANFEAGYGLDGTPAGYHEWLNNGSSFRNAAIAADGSVVALTDFFIGGTTAATIYVTRFDTAGVVAWTTTVSQSGKYYLAGDIVPAPDGGFLFSGSVSSVGFVAKIDDSGQLLWEKDYNYIPNTQNFGWIKVLRPTLDGTGYWAFSTTDSYIPQIVALRLDLLGNKQWQKIFGAFFTYNEVRSAVALPDGVLAGGYNSLSGYKKSTPYVFRTDGNGNTNLSGAGGKVQADLNGDCIADADSLQYGNIVQAWRNGLLINQGSVGAHGDYFIPLDSGQYKITVLKQNPVTHFCPDTIPVTVIVQDTVKHVDFTAYYHPEPIDSVYGSVFEDLDGDCMHDQFEQGRAGWTILLQMTGSNSNTHTYTAVTDAGGKFAFHSLGADGFTNAASGFMSISPPAGDGLTCTVTCPQSMIVNFDSGLSFQSNIGVHCDSLPNCVVMDVDMSVSNLRPCHSSTYHINYCNNSAVTATNVYLEATIDSSLLVFIAGTPWTHVSGNTYTINIGTLQPEQCGNVALQVAVLCDDPIGKTYCSEVHAYPDTTCAKPVPGWDGSQIQVKGKCNGDHVDFTITNIGAGNMAQQQDYIVIEDNVLLTQSPGHFLLQKDQSMTVNYQPNGHFLRMEVQQTPGAPALKMPVAWVEGCGTGNGNVSLGFVNQYPLGDQDPWLDVCCTQSTSSYDPNDKTGFPIGAKAEHFIDANTDIEYMIRFQNTGNAPAEYVEVRDTIPVQLLDPKTVRPGASSHFYQWDMQGNGVVVFRFPNIYLPDSSKGDVSHGFVNFRVSQRKDLPVGTKILNKADIYFDQNADVITNQTFHVIGKDYITVDANTPFMPDVRVTLAPNPAYERISVRVDGMEHPEGMWFRVYSALGTILAAQQFNGAQLYYETGQLPKGVYFYEIRQGDSVVANGKMVKM